MREQVPSVARVRNELAVAKHDVVPDCECARGKQSRRRRRIAAGMDAHMVERAPETRFEITTGLLW
jgi:hypothetical protein